MNGTTYETSDIAFASTLLYIFGSESLTGIELLPDRERLFKFEDVPRFDVEEYKHDFDSGEGLPISSAKDFMKTYFILSGILKNMSRENRTIWEAPHGEKWLHRAREQGAEIQRRREEFENRGKVRINDPVPERVSGRGPDAYARRCAAKGRVR
jgi:hypothetical protein